MPIIMPFWMDWWMDTHEGVMPTGLAFLTPVSIVNLFQRRCFHHSLFLLLFCIFLFFLFYFFGFVSYLTFTLTSYTIKNWVFGVGLFSGLFSNKIFKFILFLRLSTKPASTSLMQGWLCLVLQGLHWLIDQT